MTKNITLPSPYTIYPSLIASNTLNLAATINSLDPHVPGYHLDVMDNHFVPYLGFGTATIHALAQATTKKIWLHLMVDDPLRVLEHCVLPDGARITIHAEIEQDIEGIVRAIRANNWSPSVALKPTTPWHKSPSFLQQIDHILVMGVEPGTSGQPFIPTTYEKLKEIDQYRKEQQLSFSIGVDGGINASNLLLLQKNGADDFAIGSALFNQQSDF